MIAFAGRIELRPAPRGVPGSKDMIETFLERVANVRITGGPVGARQQPQLTKGRSVVECPLKQAPVAGVRARGGVDVLGPTPLIGLVRQDVLDKPCSLGSVKPCVRLLEIGFPPGRGFNWQKAWPSCANNRRENSDENGPAATS